MSVKARAPVRRASPRGAVVRRPWAVGAAVGLVTGVVAIGVSELIAALVGELASPIVAVGEAAVDLAPPWLKSFAIREFGSNDKLALLIGIGVLLAVLAAVMGILTLRRRWVGYAGLIGLGGVGVLAAVTRPTADALSALPSVVGVAGGVWSLRLLLRQVDDPAPRAGTAARRRPAPDGPKPLAYDRRRFLLTGAALAGGAVAAGAGGRLAGRAASKAEASRAALRIPRPKDVAPVPAGTDLGVGGLSPFVTPNASFYRVDTAIIVPKVAAQDWRLRIHGMVDREVQLTMEQLLARPLIERDVTLACVSNEVGGPYVGNARWIGAPLMPILADAGVHPDADQLVSRSADGFTIGTPTATVMDGRDAMLAVAMNGEPLPLAHGFPVRMVVPGLYGYVSATKWVVDLELSTFDAFDAYWIRRGWAQQAPVKTMSRIDTPRDGAGLPARRVAVAGVAWAQHRGIEAVEVRVDGGAWQPARLSVQDTVDTWRQWVYDWDATPGRHALQVRATDRTGYTQTGQQAPPAPNGATGWHTVVVTVG
jgi:DMSO/TMAO reductase YedYZ molybdopterin-dependent catalytic subunit